MFYTGIVSRKTPKDVLTTMTKIAHAFAEVGWTLRSGGAEGADSAFEQGAGELKEIFLPWPKFNGNESPFVSPSPAAILLASKLHPAWNRCSQGAKKLHARNMHQILGRDLKTPSQLVICWTINGEMKGGTAQAMRLAQQLEIPIFNLGAPDGLSELRLWWKETF